MSLYREDLIDKMLSYADKNKLPDNHKIRTSAIDLDNCLKDLSNGAIDIKRMIGLWAKARKIWCEETGESLI